MVAINRAEIAVFIRPFIPDGDAVFVQVLDIGVTLQEPEQFMDDRAQVQLLGGDGGKSGGQIVASLVAKDAERAGAGAVFFAHAVIQNKLHEIEVLSHVFSRGLCNRFR